MLTRTLVFDRQTDNHVERADIRRPARFRIPQQFYGEGDSRAQRRSDAVSLHLSGAGTVELSNESREIGGLLAEAASSRIPMRRRVRPVLRNEESYTNSHRRGTTADICQRVRQTEVVARYFE